MVQLSVDKLHVSIGGKTVCSALEMNIRSGECWAVLGPNGAGKTTLMRTLCGLHAPDGGHIRIDGQPLERLSGKTRAHKIGLLFQHYDDVFPATVTEIVRLGHLPYHSGVLSLSSPPEEIGAILHELDLAGMEDRFVQSLSGGERRRVAMAMLLAQNPATLLLDEPTNHLDLHHQMKILSRVKQRLRERDQAAVMVLHDLNQAARWCTHALLLYGDGRWHSGPIREMLEPDTLSTLYGYRLLRVTTDHGDIFVPD